MTEKRDEEHVNDNNYKEEKEEEEDMELKQMKAILKKFVQKNNNLKARGSAFDSLRQFRLPVGIQLYSPPRARQTWDDKQSLPHVDWGDIFFDLFYVAAAYNLAGIVKYSPTWDGLLYFVGCFGPVVMLWENKTVFDARFLIQDDNIYHRVFEITHYCLTATAVLHIRPVKELSNPYDHRDMFVFCLAVTLGIALHCFKMLEVYIRGVGDRAPLKSAAIISFQWNAMTLLCFLAATIVSGVTFYQNDNHHHHNSTNHFPIYLCVAGWVCNIIYGVLFAFLNLSKRNLGVPINIEYLIHRYGEWTMLMLGESILSMLIVEAGDVEKYYVSFYGGLLSVIMLQYLHFRSEPHHAEDHAMRRSKIAGVSHRYLMNIYSASLILIGVSYKMLLTEFTLDSDDDAHRMLLVETSGLTQRPRYLAGSSFSTEERRKRIAIYFCFSIAVTWISLDLMSLNHKGFRGNCKRCQCDLKKHTRVLPVLFVLCRLAIILFMVSVFTYTTEPNELILSSFICIILQLILRCAGDYVFPDTKAVDHHDDSHDKKSTSSKDNMEKKEVLRKMSLLIQENFDLDDIELDPEENDDNRMWPNTTYGTIGQPKH